MTKQSMSIEWVKRVKALKRQGFDVSVTTDVDGVYARAYNTRAY